MKRCWRSAWISMRSSFITSSSLGGHIAYARSLSITVVELDLSTATMVDSLGLNLVIAVLKWSKQRGAAFRIIVGKRGVYSTMLAVGLDRQAELINTDPNR